MACVAVNSLIRTLEFEFLQPRPRPILQENEVISFNKELIESLHEKLGSVLEQLDEKRIDGIKAIKLLETQLGDVAFRVEDEIENQVVDLYVKSEKEKAQGCLVLCQIFHQEKRKLGMGKTGPSLRLDRILRQAIKDVDAIKEELEKIKNMEGKHNVVDLQGRENKDEVFMMGNSSQHATPHSKDIMVGKNNEFIAVMEMLIQHPSEQLEVVSIKGMGGIGKTTLAKQVYDDSSVRSHFDMRAWVVASQLHNKTQMLVSLLNSMGNTASGSDADLALNLKQCLNGQRYLVVMDDVWSGEAWDSIKACFPDDNNGSRILLTTRLAEVASYTRLNNDFSLQMHLLDQSESWDLFCEKASRSRSVEFEMIGRPIVEKCKGLPLAITLVAGLFSKLDSLEEWKTVAKSLNPLATTTVDEECSKLLALSYNHLPHNLKSCFLYLGIFPEDHEINANLLARLWSAEGLVKAYEDESYDMVAKRYMQELVDRNLILVSQGNCCKRKIKRVRLHDILHTFCVKEAQNKNLLHVVRENDSDFPQKGFRWLSIQSIDFHISKLYSYSKSCRFIFYFSRVTSLDFEIFNLLRVVYFNKYMFKMNLFHLVHLRYISGDTEELGKLEPFRTWNIQTLDISKTTGKNYLEFPQLLYLKCDSFCGYRPEFANHNLQSISWLGDYHCKENFLKNQFPSLKVVRIKGESGCCNVGIDKLAYVQKLEELYISVDRVTMWTPEMIPINEGIVSLKNLTKLTFCSTRFEWKGIHILCKLPRLQVLRFKNFGCFGEEWEMPEDESFCQLIYLMIDDTDLKHWKASSNNFPKLEHLLLSWCWILQEIPEGFSEILTLKSIELEGCRSSVVDSAKLIEEEHHDFGNDDMIVIADQPADKRAANAGEKKASPSPSPLLPLFSIIQRLIPCESVVERNLLAESSKIVEKNKTCTRKNDLRKIVVDGLSALGYNASICKSKWEKNLSIPAGEYECIDVLVEGERVLIDLDFPSEFEIVRETGSYKTVRRLLPLIFVGNGNRLLQIVSIMSLAARQSLKKKGMHIPPWRKAEYMKAKWLSPYSRTYSPPPQLPPPPEKPDPEPEPEDDFEVVSECGELS